MSPPPAWRRAGRAVAARCFVNDGSLDALEVAVFDALRADRDARAGAVAA